MIADFSPTAVRKSLHSLGKLLIPSFKIIKPYCLFTDEIKVPPVAFRNVEIQASIKSEDFSPLSQFALTGGVITFTGHFSTHLPHWVQAA